MKEPNKKPYTTPRLRTIKLETKEVMSNICKTPAEGDYAVGIAACSLGVQCFNHGS